VKANNLTAGRAEPSAVSFQPSFAMPAKPHAKSRILCGPKWGCRKEFVKKQNFTTLPFRVLSAFILHASTVPIRDQPGNLPITFPF
jgi:hypothetical protein